MLYFNVMDEESSSSESSSSESDSDSSEGWTFVDEKVSDEIGNVCQGCQDNPPRDGAEIRIKRVKRVITEEDADTDGVAVITDNESDSEVTSTTQESAKNKFVFDVVPHVIPEPRPGRFHSCKFCAAFPPFDTDTNCTVPEGEEDLIEQYYFSEGKIRSYVHKKNNKLSSLLNIILLGTVVTAIGLALGHMWGTKEERVGQTLDSDRVFFCVQKLRRENLLLKSKIKMLQSMIYRESKMRIATERINVDIKDEQFITDSSPISNMLDDGECEKELVKDIYNYAESKNKMYSTPSISNKWQPNKKNCSNGKSCESNNMKIKYSIDKADTKKLPVDKSHLKKRFFKDMPKTSTVSDYKRYGYEPDTLDNRITKKRLMKDHDKIKKLRIKKTENPRVDFDNSNSECNARMSNIRNIKNKGICTYNAADDKTNWYIRRMKSKEYGRHQRFNLSSTKKGSFKLDKNYNDANLNADWYNRMAQARQEVRKKGVLNVMSGKKDEAKWYFKRMDDREESRYRTRKPLGQKKQHPKYNNY